MDHFRIAMESTATYILTKNIQNAEKATSVTFSANYIHRNPTE